MKTVKATPIEATPEMAKFRFRKLVENKAGTIKVATVFSNTARDRMKNRRV